MCSLAGCVGLSVLCVSYWSQGELVGTVADVIHMHGACMRGFLGPGRRRHHGLVVQ